VPASPHTPKHICSAKNAERKERRKSHAKAHVARGVEIIHFRQHAFVCIAKILLRHKTTNSSFVEIQIAEKKEKFISGSSTTIRTNQNSLLGQKNVGVQPTAKNIDSTSKNDTGATPRNPGLAAATITGKTLNALAHATKHIVIGTEKKFDEIAASHIAQILHAG
jgi:hypothetical protein